MIKKNDILEKITRALSKLLIIDQQNIQPESALVEDLGLDSYYAVELLFELEDQYNIEIPDEEVAGFKTVNDIVAFVHNRLTEN